MEPKGVTYGSGSFNGTELFDTVSIGSSFLIQQSIGVASSVQGFEGVDGVLGWVISSLSY